MKRQEKKKKNLVLILIVIIILMALVIVFLFLKLNKKDDEQSKEWLADNCKCAEWNGTKKCPVGFELKNDACENEEEKTFTNVLVSCSKYKCPEYYVDIKEQ